MRGHSGVEDLPAFLVLSGVAVFCTSPSPGWSLLHCESYMG